MPTTRPSGKSGPTKRSTRKSRTSSSTTTCTTSSCGRNSYRDVKDGRIAEAGQSLYDNRLWRLVDGHPTDEDVSYTSARWWEIIMTLVEQAYHQWLNADPLTRLRMAPAVPDVARGWPRTENREAGMLLQAIPKGILQRSCGKPKNDDCIGHVQVVHRFPARRAD